jgi:hypothetical protein
LRLIFSGHEPFRLPETLSATAAGDPANAVTLTLYSSGQSDAPEAAKEEPKAVSTQMSPSVARDLAICLWLAADEADSAKVRPPSKKRDSRAVLITGGAMASALLETHRQSKKGSPR